MENLLYETLRELGVKTIDEAIPLIEWANIHMEFKELKDRALAPGHTDSECAAFLSAMSEKYDPFEQEVSGIIMLKDGTWLKRVMNWNDEDVDPWMEWSHCEAVSAPRFKPLS